MDKINISVSTLSRFTGLSQDELLGRIKKDDSDELNENYEATLQELYGDKVSAIQKEQLNRGIREKAKAIEKPLKNLFAEYQIETDRVEDGIKELTEKLNQNGGEGSKEPSKLTLTEIKSLPIVQEWHNSEIKALQDRKTELESALSEKDSKIHNITVVGKAKDLALKHLSDANAVGVNAESVGLYLRALGTKNLSLAEDGSDLVVLGDDGNPIKDKMHNPVSYKDHVVSNWKFGFSEAPAGSGSPNYKPGSSGDAKIRFTDEKHYTESLGNAKDLAEKAKLRRAWSEQLREKDK